MITNSKRKKNNYNQLPKRNGYFEANKTENSKYMEDW